jgi:hypothetical protein
MCHGDVTDLVHGSAEGSINVRERPWASKRRPIDYKRCCTDQLNAQPDLGHRPSRQQGSEVPEREMALRAEAARRPVIVVGSLS